MQGGRGVGCVYRGQGWEIIVKGVVGSREAGDAGAIEARRASAEPVGGILAQGAPPGLGWAGMVPKTREREVLSGTMAGAMGWIAGVGNKRKLELETRESWSWKQE